jgi:hypothetical protein
VNWEAYCWIAWLVAFGILESIGLAKRADAMTLTFFIQHHFPRWCLAGLLGWMTYHFLIAGPANV